MHYWILRQQTFPLILQNLNAQISGLQKQIDETEADLRDERAAHEINREELETVKAQVSYLWGQHFYLCAAVMKIKFLIFWFLLHTI